MRRLLSSFMEECCSFVISTSVSSRLTSTADLSFRLYQLFTWLNWFSDINMRGFDLTSYLLLQYRQRILL